METRANYISVGLVSMLVISGVFVFLYWMLRFDEALDDRISLYVVFEDSVTGLNVGNKVLY
ncbi:MAG: MCE family protein, partial [Alphaproteobacteria bacterium]|nr:MCE family protein [Alphaproteobacteria bacterium]